MPDGPLLLASVVSALAAGGAAGWWWGRRQLGSERARWQRTLQTALDEARTDPLTQLWNRRAFDEQLATQIAVAERYGAPCAIVLIDIDDLKAINDRGGHPSGDLALKQIADLLREGSRAADLAARLAGDEFALILPQTNLEGAAVVASRLATRVLDGGASHPAETRAQSSLRASVGFAAHRQGETPVELVRRADRALYAAKQAGGGHVAQHDGQSVAIHRSSDTSIR